MWPITVLLSPARQSTYCSIYSNAGTLHHHYGLEYVRVILLSHTIYIFSSISKASLMSAYRSKVLFFAVHVWWCTPPLVLHRVQSEPI